MVNELVKSEDLAQRITYAKALAESSVIPDSYRGQPANVLVAMDFGQSMGLSPAESLYRINVIKGKPCQSAELIAALVRRAGHKLWYEKDAERLSVTAFIQRADDPDHVFSETRDAKWAHGMGLDQPDRHGNPSNYQKQPMTMLKWRATTAVAREACSEALFGVGYAPDEMLDSDVRVETVQESPASQSAADVQEAVVMASGEDYKRLQDLYKRWQQIGQSNKAWRDALRNIVQRADAEPRNLTQEECEHAVAAFTELIDKYTNTTVQTGQEGTENNVGNQR